MIRHTVTFKLKPTLTAAAIKEFFDAAKQLANINGVQQFECLKQLSNNNTFEYGLSMAFETEELYSHYCNHTYHINFVQQYWLRDVEDFLELDYQTLEI